MLGSPETSSSDGKALRSRSKVSLWWNAYCSG